MQAIVNSLRNPFRSLAAWSGLLAVLLVCFGVSTASAQIVVSQSAQVGTLAGGGWDGSQSPMGGTFVIGANGHVIVGRGYSAGVLEITQAGTQTTLADGLSTAAAAIDGYGNVYVAPIGYSSNIFKLPYDPKTGKYAGFTAAAMPSTNCQGGTMDTAACIYAPNFTASVFTSGDKGIASMAFDPAGNLLIATDALPSVNKNTIYKCDATCQTSSSATPTKIYADSQNVGAMAIDPWGNIFFVDGDNSAAGKISSLNELPLTAGTYASSPTVLFTYTTKHSYNGLSGLTIAPDGTIYFGTNGDGVFATPNSKAGGPDLAATYLVSTAGGKGIALDATGNIYSMTYNGGDVVSRVLINNFNLGATAVTGGTQLSANATLIDNAGDCTTPPTFTASVSQFFSNANEFVAKPGSTCGTAFGGSNGTFGAPINVAGTSFTVTFQGNIAGVGLRTAEAEITDSTNKASVSVALSAVGQGPMAVLDPGVTTVLDKLFTTPKSIVGDPAGNLFVADAGTGKVYAVPAGTQTLNPIGTGITQPEALAFDAEGDLLIADATGPSIIEIENTGTGKFVAGTQQTLISSTTLFGGLALSSVHGMAVGPDSTLYISDTGNKRVVAFNLTTGQTSATNANAAVGLTGPRGLAVDGTGNVYIADDAGSVFVAAATGGVTSYAVPNVPMPVGVAVDASGSIMVADAASNTIFLVPANAGVLDVTKAVQIEQTGSGLSSLWMDPVANLYATADKGVGMAMRAAAMVDFGTVVNGNSSSATVILHNAGNQTATLGTPALTAPANALFTLAAAANQGCSDAGSGTAGQYCAITATFAPITGTPEGDLSTTGKVNFSPSGFSTINLAGHAVASALTPQVITFTPPANMFVGQQVALTATGGASGNPVTFSIDPASVCLTCATLNGSTLTAAKVGSVIVVANQAGNSQYAAAAPVKATITIATTTAANVPALLMYQANWLSAFPSSGGAFAGDNPAGTSFGINAKEQVLLSTSYGKSVIMYDPATAKQTTLFTWSTQIGGVAVDKDGNLYAGGLYSPFLVKIPSVNGTYAKADDPTVTAPANCTGTDTTECAVAAFNGQGTMGGFASITFDAAGNMFVAVDDKGTKPFSIWECTVACQNTGTPAAAMLFQEPISATPATTGQLYIGGIAVDPWDNVFFTDSNFLDQTNTYGNKSTGSNVYVLPFTSGTGYAATPTKLQSMTIAAPASYDNTIGAVAVAADGTVYYADQNDAVFAIPNTKTGGPDAAHQYIVAGQGAKAIALDEEGDIFFVGYHNGDALGEILPTNNLEVPEGQLSGPAVTSPAKVLTNAFSCSNKSAFTFASSDPQFSATADTTSCSGVGASGLSTPVGGSAYPATLSFAAVNAGPQHGTLTITDTANGGVGTAKVTGIGEETPQTIDFTAPTTPVTFIAGLQITLQATGGGSNKPVVFSIDAASTASGTVAGNIVTVTGAGNLIIDANQAGGLVNGIYYADAPQVQQTVVVNKGVQTITFTPPTSPVTFAAGLTVDLAATGGGSTKPVLFTVDASSTASGTIKGNTLTVTGAGNLVINANQAADSNYAAAAQVQQTIVVDKGVQTITFTPPVASIHYLPNLKITLTATGGATANPVVFTVDPKSAATGTVAGNVLTVTGVGNLIIDANQEGDANYNAAAQVQQSINILPALPTQSITFNYPGTQVMGTPLTLVATASSGLTVTFSSSTTSVCTVSGTTVTFLKDGNCTINADQAGNEAFAAAATVPQTFIVNPEGVVPGMNLSLSLSSMTLQPTDTGLSTITIMSKNSFTGSVNFACSGLPSGYSCTFTPNPITFALGDANQGKSTNLTIKPGGSAALTPASRPLLPIATLAVALFCFGFRKRNRLQMLVLAIVCAAGFSLLSACSDSGSSKKPTPTTSTVTITATANGVSQSSTLTLVVEK